MASYPLFNDQLMDFTPAPSALNAGPYASAQGYAQMPMSGGTAPGQDYSGLIGAGVGAAGQTVSTLAQLMAASAARQQQLQNAAMDRESDSKLAKMRLDAAARMADNERRQQALAFLAQALGRPAQIAINAWDTNRASNQQASKLLSSVYG